MRSLLSRIAAIYAVDDVPRVGLRRWGIVAASAVLAAGCATAAYRWLDLPLRYGEPIVGTPAWTFSNKFHDYAAPAAFVAALVLGLLAIAALSRRVERRAGPAAEEGLHDLLCMASAPAGVWLAGLLTTSGSSLALLNVSGALVATVLLVATILSLRPADLWRPDPAQFGRILGAVILLLPAIWLAVAAAGVGLSRGLAASHATTVVKNHHVELATAVLVTVAAVAAVVLVLTGRTSDRVEHPLRRALLLVQVTFPAFFLLLVPRPWLVDGHQEIGYPVSGLAWLLIGACVVVAAWSVTRKCMSLWRTVPESPVEVFSVMSVVGVLLFLKAPPINLPSIPHDDYHFGETLVPWWSLVRQHMIPFAEYQSARGLVNYIPGAAIAGLLDGTAATLWATVPYIYLGLLLVAVPVLRRSMGLGYTALALFLAPVIDGLFEIDLVVTVFLAFVGRGFTRWAPTRWLAAWVASGTALVLYAPGQGGLAILATAPLGFFMLNRAWTEERRALGRAAAVLLGIAAIGGAFTPAGPMVWGAVRYGLEQSAINSVAHGIPWSHSFPAAGTNPWLFEMMRASWLLVAVCAGAVIVRLRSARLAESRRAVLPYAIPVFLLMMLFIPRAAGRIDPGPSRLAAASIWGLALLLPLILVASSRPGARGGFVFAWTFLVGVVLPHQAPFYRNYVHAFEPVAVTRETLSTRVDGASLGLPRLGKGFAQADHISRLVAARALLDHVLDSGETYLDLTNHHADYFYLDRRPPIETGAVYNLVAETQQLRAVESLRKAMPPAVLVAAGNILHDGGPIGLRSPLMYRYVLLHLGYRLVETEGQVWLVRADRIPRLPSAPAAVVSEIDASPAGPLQRVLRVANLWSVPASWGRSASGLEPKMRLVRELPPGPPTSFASVDRVDDGRYRVTGADPFIRFDIGAWNLSGREAGILAFDFHCERWGPPPVVEVYWATERSAESEQAVVRFDGNEGHLVVPLDAAPAWLLASKVLSIRFDVADEHSCGSFSIENVRLLQRHGADAVDRT